ncbi:MAG TPA: hypothetical protein VF046_02245 [Gemmatimonadales bacterium]
MSAQLSAAPPVEPSTLATAPKPPVSERTAFAVLGSMLFLIVMLTFLLVQTTWVDPASASDVPVAADGSSLAQR